MSKKIIYLLSLVMALSLVFASCKKTNGITGGDLPSQVPDTTKPPTDSVGENGLFTDKGELDKFAEKRIQGTPIAQYANNNYMRNPVITVVDGSTVVVFYEVRYESPGSENDTALTGTNVVDIVYTVSKNAGMSFDTSTDTKYVGGKKAGNTANSHGAPIVFYDKTHNKLVVVASAGIGLGVGSESKGQSRLEYSVASVTGGDVGAFSEWKEIDNITTTDIGGDFKQFGTHPARGVVTSGGKLLLPVTVAKFVNQGGSWGQSQWGYVLYEGSTSDGKTYTFEKKGNAVKMNIANGTKATRIAAATDTDYIALTVSDNGYVNDTSKLRLYQAENPIASGAKAPTATTIQAADGAAGTLVVKDWKGSESYDPKTYASSFDTASGAKSQAIFSHVLELEKKLAIRLVNEDFTAQTSTGSFIPDSVYSENSKSSSLDILKDGTIVMAAEGGKVATTDKLPDHARPFFIHFYRYSQAYIVNQTK